MVFLFLTKKLRLEILMLKGFLQIQYQFSVGVVLWCNSKNRILFLHQRCSFYFISLYVDAEAKGKKVLENMQTKGFKDISIQQVNSHLQVITALFSRVVI